MRLTSDKNVGDMSVTELAHNSCYADNKRNARYRDYEIDIDSREFVKKLLKDMCNEDVTDMSNEDFDDYMNELSTIGANSVIGVLAMFYQNLWSKANLREVLKQYEDAEEQGRVIKLPCRVGETVYKPNPIILQEIVEIKIESVFIAESYINISGRTTKMKYTFCCKPEDFGKTVFLTKSEAEEKLEELRGEEE